MDQVGLKFKMAINKLKKASYRWPTIIIILCKFHMKDY